VAPARLAQAPQPSPCNHPRLAGSVLWPLGLLRLFLALEDRRGGEGPGAEALRLLLALEGRTLAPPRPNPAPRALLPPAAWFILALSLAGRGVNSA
jgi:hypothetical protein